jgi:hypothetical protein
VVISISTFVVSLAGCTQVPVGSPIPDKEDPSNAYSTEYQAALAAATSDFELKVLEDGEVSGAEYEEAMNLYFECLESRGLTVTPQRLGSGLYAFEVTGLWNEAEVNAAIGECAEGTSEVIEPLYSMVSKNPRNRDVYELTAECLVAVGFVDAPFTAADFKREFDTSEFAIRVMDDASGARCIENPNHHNGGNAP